jgi:purine-binding chemotaxis protein CheW
MSVRKKLCTFRLAEHWFGIEVASVQEVLRHQPVTALRWANDSVQGVLNLRGQIVTAIDLRHELGMPARPASLDPTNVVVRSAGSAASAPTTVSLWVDEVGDVAEVEGAQFERTPPTLTGVSRELIRGVYKLDDHLLLALDLPRVLSALAT